jgi:hypothetical protein
MIMSRFVPRVVLVRPLQCIATVASTRHGALASCLRNNDAVSQCSTAASRSVIRLKRLPIRRTVHSLGGRAICGLLRSESSVEIARVSDTIRLNVPRRFIRMSHCLLSHHATSPSPSPSPVSRLPPLPSPPLPSPPVSLPSPHLISPQPEFSCIYQPVSTESKRKQNRARSHEQLEESLADESEYRGGPASRPPPTHSLDHPWQRYWALFSYSVCGFILYLAIFHMEVNMPRNNIFEKARNWHFQTFGFGKHTLSDTELRKAQTLQQIREQEQEHDEEQL